MSLSTSNFIVNLLKIFKYLNASTGLTVGIGSLLCAVGTQGKR